ncbi:TonB-dependent receptor [Sulfidibacter corallicola]|uniref:TonB-dependent receptor n=1 Tax=Sulfidibacter corallicola TaxID=2818388 RepID=A0A8A4THM7_SULCO|nr:TonB-dependent receptor [Sulfidibacter corallicola]QTD49559.1 TonB-dependent receptor [Sulfidibacter corallicola]
MIVLRSLSRFSFRTPSGSQRSPFSGAHRFHRVGLFLLLVLLAPLCSPVLFAQKDSSGTLRGKVIDNQDAPLPGATISIRHALKGITRSTSAQANGSFLFRALPIGAYEVRVTMDGFETLVKDRVVISLGSAAVLEAVLVPQTLEHSEQLVVTASTIKSFDLTNTTSGLVIDTRKTEELPVRTNHNAVALLAPSTTQGDSDFGNGNLVSFGGASVGENGYYLNGLNITDIRKGIGAIRYPWEAVDQVQVKTGGTPAEFGRHIGGVVNMVTKSGTNEFQFGVRTVWDPRDLAARNPTTFWPDAEGNEQLIINNSEDTEEWQDYNVFASGPIVKDKAFFYILANPRRYKDSWADTSTFYTRDQEGDFWLAKLDWYITESHSIELLGFNNELETTRQSFAYDFDSGSGDAHGNTYFKTGGDVWTAKYNWHVNDTLSVSAMYGQVNYVNNQSPDSPELAAYWDSRSGTWVRLGDWVAASINTKDDQRTNFRVDVDWVVGNHGFRFGYDDEDLDIEDLTTPTGDGYYEYYRAEEDNPYGLAPGTDYVDRRVFIRGGNTGTTSSSIYIHDTWSISPSLTLNLGLRNTTFKNTTSDGATYVDIDNQIAPRVGISWDPQGEGRMKLYTSYGRFFMPISPNTNVRMASGELDEHFISYLLDVNPDGSPVLGDLIQHDIVSNGQVPDSDRLFNGEAGPMYSDEYVVGYEQQLESGWRVGARVTYRDLVQSIEDISINYGLNDWIAANYPDAPLVGGWFPLLTNPGSDVSIPYDVDGDGVKEDVFISADDLGFPESSRKYYSLEMSAEGRVGDSLLVSGSYTWAHSYGNTEGLLRSDNDQSDPGWTTSFDYPELMDHGYGDLPNDRRHQLKLYGSYRLPANFTLGFNGYAMSGRPLNSFGVHPGTDCEGDCYGRIWYGAVSFFTDGEPVPRGSAGRTPWVTNLDLNLGYRLNVGRGAISLKAEVYNVMNTQKATQLEEYGEFDSGANQPYYGQPTDWQNPRSVRFSFRYEF